MVLESSTVITPSLPTLSIASAMISPICWSAAEISGRPGDLSVSTSLAVPDCRHPGATAFSMPRLSSIGFAPAATVAQDALADHGLEPGTVAVVVPSPATSSVFLATSRTSSAPIFS